MKVCVTGGSGFIGAPLCAALAERGDTVTLLSRQSGFKGIDFSVIVADLVAGKNALMKFVDDCDVIYHCAGEIKNNSLMYDLHVRGTANLLAAVYEQIKRTAKPVHWVQLSSTGAYGDSANEVTRISEGSPPAPVGEYEITKTISDELVLNLASMEPLFTCTILRPSIVIGSDMPNMSFYQMIDFIRKRLFFYIGSKQAVCTYVHVDDVVRALLLCSADNSAKGEVFILSNDCLLVDMVDAISKELGVPRPFVRLPEYPLRLLVRLISPFFKLPLTNARIDALVKKGGYDSNHIKNTLGFKFQYSIPEIMPDFMSRYKAKEIS